MVASTTRIRIGLLFGGRSAEHDVSVLSATNVARALDPGRYDIVPIFVTRDGLWLQSRLADRGLDRPAGGPRLCLVPGGRGRMVALPSEGMVHELPRFDALFPVLHGLHGEDGAPQGAAAVAGVPLVGCDLLGSAVALDKAVAKRLLAEADEVLVNEVNTIPGFTDISMYPKLIAASGIAYPDLIDRLVRHGLARAGR